MSEGGRGKIRIILPVTAVCFSVLRLASGVPTTNSNPQTIDTNQFPVAENVSFRHADYNGLNLNRKAPSGEPIHQDLGPYLYRRSQGNPQQQQQQYVANFNSPTHGAYAREASSSSGSSPFFGLSSNGEFQVSAFFSHVFWGVVAMGLATALIIWLIRTFFPKQSIGGIVEKIKESPAGKSLNLDRLTNIVYDALDNYGKYLVKESQSQNFVGHGNYGKLR